VGSVQIVGNLKSFSQCPITSSLPAGKIVFYQRGAPPLVSGLFDGSTVDYGKRGDASSLAFFCNS
jgi:hypothetical protein